MLALLTPRHLNPKLELEIPPGREGRCWKLEVLGRQGNPGLADEVVGFLDDSDWEVRAAAHLALVRLGRTEYLSRGFQDSERHQLLGRSCLPVAAVCQCALRYLPCRVESLDLFFLGMRVHTLGESVLPWLPHRCRVLVKELGEAAHPRLREELERPDFACELVSVNGVTEGRNRLQEICRHFLPESFEPLEPRVPPSEPDPAAPEPVSEPAVGTVGKVPPEEPPRPWWAWIEPQLVQNVEPGSEPELPEHGEGKAWALEALGRTSDRDRADEIVPFLEDSDWEVRAAAHLALVRLGRTEFLSGGFQDPTRQALHEDPRVVGQGGSSRACLPVAAICQFALRYLPPTLETLDLSLMGARVRTYFSSTYDSTPEPFPDLVSESVLPWLPFRLRLLAKALGEAAHPRLRQELERPDAAMETLKGGHPRADEEQNRIHQLCRDFLPPEPEPAEPDRGDGPGPDEGKARFGARWLPWRRKKT